MFRTAARIVSATVIAMLLTVPVLAKDVAFTACTADHLTAGLGVTLNDQALAAQPSLEQDVATAFAKTAAELPAEALVEAIGYQTFLSHLSDTTKQAIDDIVGPPVLFDVTCQ